MKGLDLRKFKKVLVEHDATHLEHPSGHKIIVSHKLISPELKKQLNVLPMYDGGKVPATDEDTSNVFKKAFNTPTPAPSPEPTQEDKYEAIRKQNRANFGYADGGQVKPQPPPTPVQSAQDSMRKAFHFADGGSPIVGEEQHVPASQLESQYAAEDAQAGGQPQGSTGEDWAKEIGNDIPNVDPNASSAPIPPVDASHAHLAEAVKNLSSKYTSSPVPSPQPEQAQPAAPLMQPQSVPDPGQPGGNYAQQAVKDVNVANKAESAAAGNLQAAQAQNAETYGHEASQMQELHQKYEDIGNQIHQKYEDLADQVSKGHIDPNQWWNSKSTGSQIATAIGMMFAGAGLGASGHPELASKAIDDAINRDIDSQKHDLSNKQSLLGKYMEMYNNLPQAEAAARLTMHASTEGLINQQAAKLGSQNAQNAATIANAGRRQQLLPSMEGLAKGQALTNMYDQMGKQGSAPSGSEAAHQKQLQDLAILNPERYKIEEAKYLPGIGVSAKPMPEKVVDEITARKDLSSKLAELENFSREHSGTVMDRKIVNQGAALARNVQDAYRRGNAQGVFKESEKDFVEKSISSDPTAFFSKIRTLPGYQTVRKLNDDTIKHYQKAYGVKSFQDTSQSGGQNQQAMEWLKANPNDPRAAAVKAKLGI